PLVTGVQTCALPIFADLGIERRVRFAALVVIVDHFFDRLQVAVVHVRRRARGFAQTRRLERAAIPLLLGDGEPARVAGPSDSRGIGRAWWRERLGGE